MTDNGETTIKVKLWGVIVIFSILFGWFFVAYANHDRRLTTLETQYVSICDKLGDIRTDTKDIKQSMSDHVKGDR